MGLTDQQKLEYFKNSNQCPYCKSTNISGDEMDLDKIEYNQISQRIVCLKCGKVWKDILRTSIINIEECE